MLFRSLGTLLSIVSPELPAGARAEFDPILVRGMGYYTGTIFEIVSPSFPSSIAGGGRYDRMVGRLLGQDVPACGFSIGFERVVSILEGKSDQVHSERDRIAFLFEIADPLAEVAAEAGRLRGRDRTVSLTLKRKNLARQLDDLAGEGFGSYAVFRSGQSPEVKTLVRRTAGAGGTDA